MPRTVRRRRLDAAEHRSKERILTHSDPAKVRKTSDAVVLKAGSVFLVVTESGDIPFEGPHGYGLYFHDCRFLDGYTLRINGSPPAALAGTADRAFRTHHHLTTPVLREHRRLVVDKNTVGVLRERVIRGDAVHERMTIHNYGRVAIRLHVQLAFRARFEDLFVLKGFVQGPRGARRPPVVHEPDCVVLGYQGRDVVVNPVTFAGLLLASTSHGEHIAEYLTDLATTEGQMRLREREVTQGEVGQFLKDVSGGRALRHPRMK